jgi:hypothetical protein
MGMLLLCPSHYEGVFWLLLYLVLLAALPVVYNIYNSHGKYVAAIPMQNSLLQSTAFILFMMSMFCASSILPCGRYYYEPEGGYVGNP